MEENNYELEKAIRDENNKKVAKKLTGDITDFLNTFGDKSPDFIEAMSCDHRTLQQSFTRLALQWIEHVGSSEYRTDGRNEGSHKVCKKMIRAFHEKVAIEEGYTGDIDYMIQPSLYCGYI